MSTPSYLDFDLLIESSGTGYRARLINSPAGQATVDFELPFSDLEVENFLLRVGRTRRGVRRLESPEMKVAKDFGGRLFDAVFDDDMRAGLRGSLDAAHEKGAGLRIRLHLNDVPELGDLPWEYLYNPSVNRFLVLSVETPIVRYLDLVQRIHPLKVTPPLRMLLMISSPRDYPRLDVEAERAKLRESLADLERRGLVSFDVLEEATLSALQKRLRRDQYHVFHFIGHGGFDRSAQDGILLLETESEQGRPVSGQDLGTLLHDHRPLRLAVLNACEGARASRTDPFAGVAQSLVQQGIPAVIAMQFEVTDAAAITFAHELYGAVADGYPVDAALAEARKALFAEGNDVEWGTPVLYMRSHDGWIFDLAGVAKPATPPTPPPAGKRKQRDERDRLEKLYTEALSYFYTERWEDAVETLSEIISLEPDYGDAAEKLERALARQRLAELRARADAAVEANEWNAAVKHLEAIVELDPNDPGAPRLLEETRGQAKLARLYDETRRLCEAERWQAAVNVIARIEAEEAGYPDPLGLFELARHGIESAKRERELADLYALAVRLIDEGEWREAMDKLERVSELDAEYKETPALLARARARIEKEEREAARAEEEALRAEEEALKEKQEALEAEREAMRAEQETLAARWEDALKHLDAGRFPQAIADLEAILESSPEHTHPEHGSIASLLAQARERALLPSPPEVPRPAEPPEVGRPVDLPEGVKRHDAEAQVRSPGRPVPDELPESVRPEEPPEPPERDRPEALPEPAGGHRTGPRPEPEPPPGKPKDLPQ